ncbi:MAG: RNA-protein complex protein Nop10 [Nitrososphaerota archaeon]
MHFQLRKCSNCNRYTLKNNCSACNEATVIAHPSKFSPDDKYLRYRIAERYKQ